MAADIIPPIPVDAPFASYNWVDWYQKVRRAINEAQDLKWSQFTDFTGSNLNQLQTRLFNDLQFAGSNLTSIATRNHNDLQSLQGGTTSQYYHLTSAQQSAIASGITTTITTAKLTALGSNGSMTFTNGILTAQTQAT